MRMLPYGVFCLPLLFNLACFHAGPYYEVVDAYQDDPGYRLVLAKSMTSYSYGVLPSRSAIDYYLASTNGDARQATVAPALKPALASEGGWDQSTFAPIKGTSRWVHIRSDLAVGGSTVVDIIDPVTHRNRTLTTFADGEADRQASAFALSHSGRSLLVVGPKRVALWDLSNAAASEPSDLGVLSTFRKFLADNRGSVGTWWMTDDLRFVVVAPSHEVHDGHGSLTRSSEPMNVNVAGVMVDVQNQGIIYDRRSGKVTPFYTILWPDNARLQIVAVIPTDQQPLLVYAATDHYEKEKMLLIAGADHIAVATHTLDVGESDVWLSSYDDRTGDLVLVGRSGQGPPSVDMSGEHPRDYFVYRWNWRSGATRRIHLPAAAVARAIEGK